MKAKQLTISFLGTVIRAVVLILVVLFIYKAGVKAYDFGFRIFTEEPMTAEPGRDIEVTITQGDSVGDVGKMLEEKGLVRDAQLFSIQKLLSQYTGDIQPGVYTLNTSMTAEEMFAILLKDETPEEGEAASEPDELTEAAPLTEADPLTEDGGTTEDELPAEDTGDVQEGTTEE
ncbi:MAG: endolytic transglycosylase MltG [Lachnospiraceae bacterium]